MKAILTALALTLNLSAAHAETASTVRKVVVQRYALALSLAEALDTGAVCEANAYPSEIVQEVEAANAIGNTADLDKFLADLSESSPLRRNLAFREAIGQINFYRTDITQAEVEAALTGTVFYHFGQGAYGSGYNVTLEAGGRAQERILDVLNEEPWSRWKDRESSWSVVPNKEGSYGGFNLKVGDEEFRLERQEEGEIWWVPLTTKPGETDYLRTLSTSDSYCDA